MRIEEEGTSSEGHGGQRCPRISILVLARNNETDIERCLHSLAALNYPREQFEVIVVDGHSTDRTVAIARSSGARVVDQGSRKGRVGGLNAGMDYVRGEYVAFTDADCAVDPMWLARAMRYFDDDSVAGVGGHCFTPSDADPVAQAVTFILYFLNPDFPAGHLPRTAWYTRSLAGSNAVYDVRKLKRVFPLPEHTTLGGEDAILSQQIRDLGYKLVFSPDVLVWHYPSYSSNALTFVRKMTVYGRARVQMQRLDRRFSRLVNWLEGFSVPLLAVAFPLLFLLSRPAFFGILALGGVGLLGLSVLCLYRTGSFHAAVHIPALVASVAVGYSAGFLQELFFPRHE